MTDAPAGRSYAELVMHAFRKNWGARAALRLSVAMIVVAILTPLLANDRPFTFKGTLPGEYRRAHGAVTRGAMMNLVTLPARLRGELAKHESNEATLHEFLERLGDADRRATYESLERLRKIAEGRPEIRGRWASRDVPMSEVLEGLEPAERPAFEAARRGILARLPAIYAARLAEAFVSLDGQLADLDAQRAGPARGPGFSAKVRGAVGESYLATMGGRSEAIRGAFEEIRNAYDPEKASLVPRRRWPLFSTLGVLDVFLVSLVAFAGLAFGPLTWVRLRAIRPLERRWRITWGLALVPATLVAAAWGLVREHRFDSLNYARGAADGTIVMDSSLWPVIRHRYDQIPDSVQERFQGPSLKHPFGTDFMGRDLLARMLWGSRISLSIGFAATAITVFIGVVVGALAGYFGGWVDMVISRFIEIMICFPRFFIILAVVAFLPPNIFYVMLALGLFGWMGIARLQRGEFLRLRGQEFVTAARALGASSARVMFRHVLPNGVGPVLVTASFGIAGAMLAESSLSFLGLGVQEPDTSWGQILQTGRTEVLQQGRHWWTYTIPGAAIFLAVTCYNLVGDGIRDAVDPRLKS
jgi:peptide/nickel transport system permease protein